MSLQVDVLYLEPLPVVRLIVSDVPSGTAWAVRGSAGGQEWLAGEGTSPGDEVVFADPWAPLGTAATYTLTHGTTVEESGPVVRTYDGEDVVTDLSGRVAAEVVRGANGDPRDWDPRFSSLDVAGSPLPVSTFGPVAGRGGGAVVLRTVAPHTETLAGLVEANRPILLLHNAAACEARECDITPVRTVMFTGVGSEIVPRIDRRERSWSLTYRLTPRPHQFLAPVATWADVAARWPTYADLTAEGLTNAELARADWLVGW